MSQHYLTNDDRGRCFKLPISYVVPFRLYQGTSAIHSYIQSNTMSNSLHVISKNTKMWRKYFGSTVFLGYFCLKDICLVNQTIFITHLTFYINIPYSIYDNFLNRRSYLHNNNRWLKIGLYPRSASLRICPRFCLKMSNMAYASHWHMPQRIWY